MPTSQPLASTIGVRHGLRIVRLSAYGTTGKRFETLRLIILKTIHHLDRRRILFVRTSQ